MSRSFAIFTLMFAFSISAFASTATDAFGTFESCQVMADEKKDEKKEGEEEAEPECD